MTTRKRLVVSNYKLYILININLWKLITLMSYQSITYIVPIYLWNKNNNLHDVELEDRTSSSKTEATVLSCNNFLLLSAQFLLKVASISKSRGTKWPIGDLCIQNTDRNIEYPIQEENKYKQNKYSQVIKE